MRARRLTAWFLPVFAVLAAAPDLPARHYTAREGRFLQRDPIRFEGGDVNLYAYTGGNPVNRTDPLGESWLSWLFGYGYSGPRANAFDASLGRSAIGKWEEVSAGAVVLWDDGPLESRRLLVDAMAQRYALVMIHQGEGRMYVVAANDLAGTTNLMEGVYGVDVAQERNLDRTERWQRGLMGGGQTVLTVAGAQSTLSSLRAGYTGTGVRPLVAGLKDAGRWATTLKVGPRIYRLNNILSKSVATGRNQAVFWSGRRGANRLAAEAFAKAHGKFTLDMTPGGMALEDSYAWSEMTLEEIRKAATGLSLEFAEEASGDVTAFTGGAAVDSVWNTIEFPALLDNPNVTKIIIRDAVNTAKTRIIYNKRW